jgi:hypothetical protein
VKKNFQDEGISSAFVTWDFETNKEHSMFEIPDCSHNKMILLKGINSASNYCVQPGKYPFFCSLENGFPLKCFNFKQFASSHKHFETSISENQDLLLNRSNSQLLVSNSVSFNT